MRSTAIAIIGAVVLGGCTGVNYEGAGLTPIPGSITYRGQPHGSLTKSPIGWTFPHDFTDQFGRQMEETYIIRPDRTLAIVGRQYRPDISRND
ncbi:hypothetical protein FHX08_003604 [Rhizobium sp. BK529]|uniref:hypothetical protein n=1 Tax=unclassified Rhizobium TaxID=2613769 RepID=UPI00104FCB17|nr:MULTISPECIES: hypothetical protein [unclassified Rhizobium]MBB3593201.1 hypothetical protein [Rhizobium sp. BK529]TCS03001.1 hypothetical protein EV281_10481 [Rhizobium sp. BK418]